MNDISNIFDKTDIKCSNIFLLDENLCLGSSLNVINYNVQSLSSALVQLDQVSSYLNQVYTMFTKNSAAWLEGNKNLQNNYQKWNNDYTLVYNLSSSWATEFPVFYTKYYEITDWYNKETGQTYSNGEILSWLNNNFPTNEFESNQIISVYVNLYYNYHFNMTQNPDGTPLKIEYTHDCHLGGGTATINCTTCPSQLSHGCNHHGGAAGGGPCDNAFDHCSTTTTGQTVAFTCVPYGPSKITIGPVNTDEVDSFLARNIRLRYINNGNSWLNITYN